MSKKEILVKKLIAAFGILVLAFSVTAIAHPGRTDSNGGHNDRKNGGYHYHNSGSSSSTRSTNTNDYTFPASTTTNTPESKPNEPAKDPIRRVENFRECTIELTALNRKIENLSEMLENQQKDIIRLRSALKKNGIDVIED